MICNMENDNLVLPEFKPQKYKKLGNKEGVLHFQCHSLTCGDRTLVFPPKAKTMEEEQAQKINYDYFIQTMTELVKKYASDIED